jgi:transposase
MSRLNGEKKSKRRRVIGGVDTHGSTHHAAVIAMTGRRLADAAFPATAAGYAQLLAWLVGFGRLVAVGVEGTGSYGKGLARHLHGAGVSAVEVNRPDRRERRRVGKSDPLDAYAAAEAVLAQRATVTPKTGDGPVEAIRVLHATRAGAVKARTAAANQLRAVLVTAPAALRELLQPLGPAALIEACTRLRPAAADDVVTAKTKHALRALARRHRTLSQEITDLETHLHPLIAHACPDLLAIHGVGPETAAQLLITAGDNPDRLATSAAFAALCGVAPVPASSGKTNRHRLSRGGDRQANRALYIIICSRLASCARTKAYRDRRQAEGLSNAETIRCLKRYLAREIYKALTSPNAPRQDQQPAA